MSSQRLEEEKKLSLLEWCMVDFNNFKQIGIERLRKTETETETETETDRDRQRQIDFLSIMSSLFL